MNSSIDQKNTPLKTLEFPKGLPPQNLAFTVRYRERFRLLYLKIVASLPFKVEESYGEECWNFFMYLDEPLKKKVGFHSHFELAPAVIYLFFRRKKVPLFTNTIILASGIQRHEVERALLFMIKTFPRYQMRFSYQIARQKIHLLGEILQLAPAYEAYTLKVLRAFYPFLRHTKEDLILATVCSLSLMAFGNQNLSIHEICEAIGVAMSAVQYQVKNHLFRPLHIAGFTSLKASTPLIQKLVLSRVPLPPLPDKGEIITSSKRGLIVN